MNREEFLEILNIQLEGEIPSNEISQHLAYYNNFINQKIRQGKSEEDVLNELGDPRLIAKTLIDTEDVPNTPGYQQSYAYSAEEAGPGHFAQEESQQEEPWQETPDPGKVYRLDLSTWKGKLIVAAAAAVLLAVIGLISVIIGALLPFAAIAVVVGLIIAMINRP